MTFALVGTVLACLAACGGLGLAWLHFARRYRPRWLLWVHPAVAIVALICLWIVFALWQGPRNLPFDAGIVVLSFAFVAGAFLYSLRVTRLPVPLFVVGLHGLVALGGCALLILGLLRFGVGSA